MLDGKNLGALIKHKRKEKHLKQTEMAKALGLSRTYLSDIENGRYLPSTKTLSRIAIFINLDLNVLKMTEIQVVKEGGYDRAAGTCRSKAL
ncbi:XRE family transcriptional regulator [Bacillus atrophaeus]|uniref:helix-turn-helix domain-containing protein n=1 Tax=Bacillus atrophaeus TaxID=1452 RepID=UPI000D0349B7|nr:helix-turn-helix transcriptional regulator [Bacillus atrophaeus]MED1016770.1 helix-turn-helix transcriptional regulator [Bacillus atrophaeus]MED1030369.1 helix-turn-helix transcriptional regulator [Bacillus atrophaeus]MED1118420.1 helix-turn-helix transcriptional regulator [Bacillus atrophaeus]MED1132974.1 helix-turn-helix transcriptional regulator [Bacillus atrophaeus]PRS02416.1 XRE family transcriptional regulator [Bacillus atrophaeus]